MTPTPENDRPSCVCTYWNLNKKCATSCLLLKTMRLVKQVVKKPKDKKDE